MGHHHAPHDDRPLPRRAWGRDEAIGVLESPDRRASQDPEALWDRVGLRAGQRVADVGAGTGFFALPAARRVGASGRVFAVDLSEELVALIAERARSEGLVQLSATCNTLDSIPLDSASVDVVLLANVLHDFPPSTVAEAVRLLRPGGTFVNVDWKPGPSPGGPPEEIRLTPEAAATRLGTHGLNRVDRWEFGPYHYVVRMEKAARP